MKRLKKTLCAAALAGVAALPFATAQAWWGPWGGGGPWGGDGWGNDGWGDGWGDGSGDFDFNMSGGAHGSGYGRGYRVATAFSVRVTVVGLHALLHFVAGGIITAVSGVSIITC